MFPDQRRPEPVRGQLELFDSRAHGFWIQCTDIPNEIKVLLPYGTGKLYRDLLDIEIVELQKPNPSWSSIAEIRAIKDRMIRKCQRTFDAFPRRHIGPQDSRSVISFHSFTAPLDFRLREMEKWLRVNQEQQIRVDRSIPHEASYAPSYSTGDDTETTSQSTNSPPPVDQAKGISDEPQEIIEAELPKEHSPVVEPPREQSSPLPLPHPYLSSIAESQAHSDSEAADVVVEPIRPTLTHRRSCIKRSSSSDIKTVSWAQRRDFSEQLVDHMKAVEEVRQTGHGWDNIRTACSDLDVLHLTVIKSLERMRTETEHLHAVEESIRTQRDKLQDTIARFEREESEFREKVQAMLRATDQLCSAYTS